MPVIFYSKNSDGNKLPVSFYIADSITKDLNQVGYQTTLANDKTAMKPMSAEDATFAANKAGADYLVTTKVTDGMTNFWGFLIIPFVEPVWTRIAFSVEIADLKAGKEGEAFHTSKKKTEWYFAKITILDAIFDAGIFGPMWHQSAWGKTVVSDALADAVKEISKKIGGK